MTKKFTILVAPVNAVGHTNACAGATSSLLKRGHRVVFLIEESFRGKLSQLGFEEFIYSIPKKSKNEKPGEKLANSMVQHKLLGPETAEVKIENWRRLLGSPEYQEGIVALNEGLKQAVKELNPDLIYYDGNWLAPEIYYCGKPWVKNVSVVPIFYEFEEDLPPGGSGLPTNGDRAHWERINEIRKPLVRSKSYNDLLESIGYSRYPEDHKAPPEQILTVYAYPEELNYPAIQQRDWFNLEVFTKPTYLENKTPLIELNIPETFLNDQLDGKFSGKLIYVSMGSMGSANLDLMRKLVDTLGKTSHKYIVSKGVRHLEYNLPRNMYGDRYLDQPKIVPHVDLVITHGGNNTVTETFAAGKPMIVLPLFVDQFDNAQRLQETGFGARIDPFEFEDQELHQTIDRLIYDEGLKEKLSKAARRIQESNRHEELAVKIEKLLSYQN